MEFTYPEMTATVSNPWGQIWKGGIRPLYDTRNDADTFAGVAARLAEITGDRNPIHLSEHFAAKTPFGTRIAHGLYTASLISAVLGTRLPGPGAIYISQTLNFKAPVKIGDEVVVRVEVAELIPERRRARLACTCKVKDELVLEGEAWVKVPSRAETQDSPLRALSA